MPFYARKDHTQLTLKFLSTTSADADTPVCGGLPASDVVSHSGSNRATITTEYRCTAMGMQPWGDPEGSLSAELITEYRFQRTDPNIR